MISQLIDRPFEHTIVHESARAPYILVEAEVRMTNQILPLSSHGTWDVAARQKLRVKSDFQVLLDKEGFARPPRNATGWTLPSIQPICFLQFYFAVSAE